jgi:hypothetical protein
MNDGTPGRTRGLRDRLAEGRRRLGSSCRHGDGGDGALYVLDDNQGFIYRITYDAK